MSPFIFRFPVLYFRKKKCCGIKSFVWYLRHVSTITYTSTAIYLSVTTSQSKTETETINHNHGQKWPEQHTKCTANSTQQHPIYHPSGHSSAIICNPRRFFVHYLSRQRVFCARNDDANQDVVHSTSSTVICYYWSKMLISLVMFNISTTSEHESSMEYSSSG